LFFGYFSIRLDLHLEKYYSLAIVLIILLRASKAAVAIPSCSIMTFGLSLEFGAVAYELLLGLIIALRFEDIKHKETRLRIYPDKGGRYI
jgi:hypothetical protein